MVLLDAPVRYWKCPACLAEDRTEKAGIFTQFHPCPALGGVSIPLVEVQHLDEKVKARQLAVEGAVRTERMDGSNDCTVFPQPASASFT